jgi:nucleotide-binding universal stress UspA family protein
MGPIVVGYSGSEQSSRALLRAATLAEALPATLVVVAVARGSDQAPAIGGEPHRGLSPVAGLIPPSETGPASREDVAGEGEELRLRHELDRARELVADRDLSIEFTVEVGAPAERLLAVAKERGSELIVIGAREHGILERLMHHTSVETTVSAQFDHDVLLVH